MHMRHLHGSAVQPADRHHDIILCITRTSLSYRNPISLVFASGKLRRSYCRGAYQFARLPKLQQNSHALPYTKADSTQMIPQAAAHSFSIRGNRHTTARLNDKKISDAAIKKTENLRADQSLQPVHSTSAESISFLLRRRGRPILWHPAHR